MVYRRLSILARLVVILGVVGITLVFGLLLLDAGDMSKFATWLLLAVVLIVAPLEALSLVLTFFKEKIGYKLSLIFSAPFIVALAWLAFTSVKRILFETEQIDAMQALVSGGFGLLLLSPFALIVSSYILSISKNKKLLTVAGWGIISILLYLLLITSLFLVNIITLAGE
ncbi:MAG: hypothetical protein WAP23_01050 [Candidatus Spechtbacterales bacterium]